MKIYRYIVGLMMMALLMVGGVMNEVRAAKVTYHILTLPIPDPSTPGNYDYHMVSDVVGKRLEAFKVTVEGNSYTTVELPSQYKSPMAENFTYYAADDVTPSGSAIQLYTNNNTKTKAFYYTINGGASAVSEGSTLPGNTAEYYVVYTAKDTIIKLDGSIRYNIRTMYKDNKTWKDKGFFALNRGRNNRPAVLPTNNVDPEMLSSEDFMVTSVSGTGVSTYWQHNDNKNIKEDVESQFFFMFKFEGNDPYHIVIRTAYAKDSTYIEKNDGTSNFVYKWYKEGSLFAVGNANAYIASDEHTLYNLPFNRSTYPTNPTNLTEGEGVGYIAREGNWHGQSNPIWSTFALLKNSDNNGYVFMGTRTVNNDGVTPDAPNYLKETNNRNNLVITSGNSTNNLSIEGIYPIRKVTFKIATPFYKVSASTDHIISVEDQVSQYTVDNDPIETKYLPAALKRKYVNYTTKFYSDPTYETEITRFSDANYDNTEGYQVYVGYKVDEDIPFKAITPAATYSAATWTGATWYELTDEGSTQTDGLKLKYDGSNFKNNGADGVYEKVSEFAFIGDPYELYVVYRDATSGATPYYVGAAGTPPTTGTLLTAVTSATEGYQWEIPIDATKGSFLLQKYKGSGNWYWNAGHPSPVAISYATSAHTYDVATANAQTVTFNVSNLTAGDGNYLTVTVGGTDAGQATVQSKKIYVDETTATFTVAIKGRGNSDKQFTLSIQEKKGSDDSNLGGPSVITVNQNVASYTANTVEYNTSYSTRIQVLDLPKHDFTYNIVDKSGRIAVKATANQTIFSPLSLASIPSIIISPFLVGETVTFWGSYSGGGRGNLADEITELTAGNAASSTNVYVKYTTSALNGKPIKLSEDEEFNVKLNGHYVYYDKATDVIKTKENPTEGELRSTEYLWKLRNRDPYAMLIDNLGAREDLSVANQSETVTVYDDAGTGTSNTRQKGAWLKLAADLGNDVGLTFDADRTYAQQFVAKASLQSGVYEVMVADGGTVDAYTTYYNIGRPNEGTTVKIYNNSTYAHGEDELRFVLNQNVDYTYHLIDRAKHQLLTASSKTPDLALPAEYQSPLVGTYNFYALDQMTIDASKTPKEYTPTDPAVKLSSIADLKAAYTIYDSSEGAYTGSRTATDENNMKAQADTIVATGDYYYKIGSSAPYTYKKVTVTRGYRGTDIYVTYEANDLVTFNSGQYMLKFLNPYADGYYLEDGNDKLDTVAKIQAVYPYCNGDGNLNIYGNEMQKEQFGGGASTRPRWVWYFISANSDPYHVRIRSRSTISYNGVNHNTYLTTYAVHFNQDGNDKLQHIVTGGTLQGVASAIPMEYMVLGTEGNYKLLTTDSIAADLNGDGDLLDDNEKTRRYVTSFEQYWKTYNMLKLFVLEINKNTNAYSDDPATWVVPADKRTELATKLAAIRDGVGPWHSYNAYANATRWNGYNDKTNGEEKKVVENLEHWFQTFDMGNGTFDIESAEVPPVLVLLDRHGWEVMRRPLPPIATYPEGTELKALRVYDSPLVDKYYFYSNATKATGCHKYSLRMQNGAERDQVKVNGERFSSSSLGNLPPRNASGVISGGAIQDLYVTYDVKEEYEHNYYYNLDTTTSPAYTETALSQPYLMLQNGRFYKTENNNTDSSYISKPIFEYTTETNGNIYDLIINPKNPGGSSHPDILSGGKFIGNNFWYIKPNQNIDDEMGIPWTKVTGKTDTIEARNQLKKEYWLNNKSGFDPYNLQIQLVNKAKDTRDGRFMTTYMDTTNLDNGILIGGYSNGGSTMIKLTDSCILKNTIDAEGYDHTTMRITNQTFMAVSDANGNMQLMPRFDHTLRVELDNVSPWETQLGVPADHAKADIEDNSSMGEQTTFFICPQRFHYHIIDNNGREALGYKRGADFYPAITDHFKSPVAKNFTYYKGLAESETPVVADNTEWTAATGQYKRTLTSADMLTDAVKLLPDTGWYYYQIGTRGVFTYKKVHVTKGLMEQQITGSFAAMDVDGVDPEVYVRYEYDLDADIEGDRLLQGQWYTVQLAEKDLQASGTLITAVGETQGTGINLYAGNASTLGDANDKPAIVDADAKKWQWKFFVAPADPISDYYVEPDPYAVHLFNRQANYTTNPSAQPSPMAVPIKVPNANNGADRFALLSHPDNGYALAVAKVYDYNYNYEFVNGASMTTSVAATTATESTSNFNYKKGNISAGAQIVLDDDVKHAYTYIVLANNDTLAVKADQDNEEAESHNFEPYLPEEAQTPLLRMKDYKYYGFARPAGLNKKAVIEQTILYTLSGLYDDTIYVRYNAYDMDSTEFKVPNKKTVVDSHVARDNASVDVAMNINHGLPYNIIWYNDNMMQSTDNSAITNGGSHALSGNAQYIWYITGGDPYAFKIQHKGGKYVDGTTTLEATEASAPTFMLLKKTGYDYGVLQLTGITGAHAGKKLTGVGDALTTDASTDPTKFIIFGLSIHDLIYRLIIANTGSYTAIPYRIGNETTYQSSGTWTETDTIHVKGTTQRDLTSMNTGEGTHVAGEKYQLGETATWNGTSYTYCKDIGPVSIGDELVVPNEFSRPNCTFEFYIEGIYKHFATANVDEGKPYETLDNKYKGLKLNRLMTDEELIDQDVVVNIVYQFDTTVATNTGLGFVTSVDQNLWYTYETKVGDIPYLAQYTNAWGLQSKAGRDTRYTNDYLWTPLGDVYGFKMYNRYMLKNAESGDTKVMTMKTPLAENDTLSMAVPGTGSYTSGNEIFELIAGDADGYFRVHPVINNSGTRYYVWRDPSDNFTKLSTTPCDWRFGLEMDLLTPYYERAGYVGGLTAEGKTAYETAVAGGKLTDIQNVVYSDANIIHFTSGYYRMHNQPGVSGISPVRYASGYLHDIEKTAKTGNMAIPMHFFSREGVSAIFDGDEDDLGSGFTITPATRGEVPIAPMEYDPSTIFYINGNVTANNTISTATMSTQGLYVSADTMTTGNGMTYTFIDIGGATLLIADELTPATRQYLHFGQNDSIYDLKFYHNAPTDDAKWCLQPVQKTATAGNGEKPLLITTNNGGDGYYYATFYAPFDVLLPADKSDSTYYAYTCSKWYNDGVHPEPVPAVNIYAKGKFVPAGTPVIIRVKDESGVLTLTLPSNAPSESVSCVFKGSYLERLLDLDAANDVYTLGVPFISTVTKDGDYDTTGDITAPLPEKATSGVGFYINATYNKESDPLQSLWTRNNRYVLHNKIYYRAAGSGSGAPLNRNTTEYVPVLFGDEQQPAQQTFIGDGCAYDLLGRKVASAEAVQNGSWYQYLTSGIYIVNGQKVLISK